MLDLMNPVLSHHDASCLHDVEADQRLAVLWQWCAARLWSTAALPTPSRIMASVHGMPDNAEGTQTNPCIRVTLKTEMLFAYACSTSSLNRNALATPVISCVMEMANHESVTSPNHSQVHQFTSSLRSWPTSISSS
jgi:hypothetical protein